MIQHVRNLLLLIILGIVAFGYGIGKRDMWAPDEPRFAQAAKEMLMRLNSPDAQVRQSAPFVLHVNNMPYTDKPPLFIWMAAAFNGGDGSHVSNRAIRLPSVLGGILGLCFVYILGCLLLQSRQAGLLGSMILGTTVMYSWQAGRAQLDMLMSCWSYGSVLFFWLAYHAPTRWKRLCWYSMFWITAALATLSKGPPGLIVPAGGAIMFLLWQASPRKTFQTCLLWFIGILFLTFLGGRQLVSEKTLFLLLSLVLAVLAVWTACAWFPMLWKKLGMRLCSKIALSVLGLCLSALIVGIWFIPYKMFAPSDAVADTLVWQTLIRFLAADQHVEWVGYFIEKMLGSMFLPWTLFCVAGLIFAFRQETAMPLKTRRFLLSWILFSLLFFSLTPGKRGQYLLPAIPAVTMFGAWFFHMLFQGRIARESRWLRIPAWVITALPAALSLLLLAVGYLFSASTAGVVEIRDSIMTKYQIGDLDLTGIGLYPAALLFLCIAIHLFIATKKRHPQAIFAGIAVLAAIAYCYLNGWVLPAFNSRKSGRIITEYIHAYRTSPDDPVAGFDLFRAQYMLYGDYFMPVINKDSEAGDSELHEYLLRPRHAFILMRYSQWKKLQEIYPDLPVRVLFDEPIGSRGLALLDNQPNLVKKDPPVSENLEGESITPADLD